MVEFDENFNPVEDEESRPATSHTPPPPPPPANTYYPPAKPPVTQNGFSMVMGIIALLIFLGLGVFAIYSLSGNRQTIPGQQEGISVSGDGSVYVTPDIANVSVGVQKSGKTVAEVDALLSETSDKIQSALAGIRIEKKDIQTSEFNITPTYSSSTRDPQITGYTGTHLLTIKVRDLNEVDTVTDNVITAGANRIENIFFTVEDQDKALEQARADAIKKARGKAEQIAKESGVTLGKIMTINEWSSTPPIYYTKGIAEGTGGGMDSNIQTGSLQIQVTVNITYKIR